MKGYPGKFQIAVCPSETAPIGPSGQGKFDYGHYLANAHAVGWYYNGEMNKPYRKAPRLKQLSFVSIIGDSNRKNLYFTSTTATTTLKDIGGFAFRHGNDSTILGFADGHAEIILYSFVRNASHSVNAN